MLFRSKRLAAVEPAVLANGWFYDSAVSRFMGGPGRRAFDTVALIDKKVVDGAVDGAGSGVKAAGSVIRRAQTGAVRNYAAGIGIGVVALLLWFFLRGVI